MRLLTWNVYFGGHCFDERTDALVAELRRRRPEVIALQEVTVELAWKLGALGDLGYASSDANGDSIGAFGYGVVLLARAPARGFRWFDLPSEMGRALVTCELESGLTVATVHLESLDESAARLAQIERIERALAGKPDVVWCGDFNFRPDEPEQAALDPAWLDAWPALHPDYPGYTVDTDVNTMRFQLKSKPTHKRIDRVLVRGARWRPRTIERVGTTPIDDDGTFVSDHFGLEVDLG